MAILTTAFSPTATAFTPIWTQGVTITATNNVSRYIQIGKFVYYQFSLAATSAGTAGVLLSITLPIIGIASGIFRSTGACHFYSSGPGTSYVLIPLNGATNCTFTSDTSGGNNFGIVPAITVASGDYIDGVIIYEAA